MHAIFQSVLAHKSIQDKIRNLSAILQGMTLQYGVIQKLCRQKGMGRLSSNYHFLSTPKVIN